MDRRRFKPSTEGLEHRALLASLFGGSSANQNVLISIEDLPDTFKLKVQRIEHLPFYLRQEHPDRYLSPETMKQLKIDMLAIAGQLHAPGTAVVDAFNRELRHAFPYKTLSPTNAKLLSHTFGSVLARAGATDTETANLQRDLNQMALVDSLSPNPTSLASDDYSLVLQTALAVGRPIKTPAAPSLALKDGINLKNGAGGITRKHDPTLVGTYLVGAAVVDHKEKIPTTSIQIIDDNQIILGTTVITTTTGVYRVTLSPSLPDGVYKVHARAADNTGHISPPSPTYRLKIISKASAHPAATQAATQVQNPQSAPFGV
jgi:hypothetical protein